MNPGLELDALVAEKVMGWSLPTAPEERHEWQDVRIPQRQSNGVVLQEFLGYVPKGTGNRVFNGIDDKITIISADEYRRKTMWLAPPDGREGFNFRAHPPYYSTSIADAWEVVEKIRAASTMLHIDWHESYGIDNRRGWSVAIDGIVRGQFVETAPHAICLAALKAAGVEIPRTERGEE